MKSLSASKYLAVLILAGLGPTASGTDGEGLQAHAVPDRLVAGSRAHVTVEVTVGPSGIPVGGGIVLGLHHAATWPGLQVSAPEKESYVSVTCGTPDNFDMTYLPWGNELFADKTPSGRSDNIHHQCFVARVKHKALEPGERVQFVLGANEHKTLVQRFVDPSHEFHVSTDVDGDGIFKGIPEQPRVAIVAGPAHHLVGSVSAELVIGEPFELQIRAEDPFFNLATTFSGTVTVTDENGSVLAEAVQLEQGMTRMPLKVNAPGPRRFRLASGALTGRANPCRAFEEAPDYRLFWGDIHGHTSISDGLGETADAYFAFGRDVADLDVCALTDHGHFDWPQTIAAVKKHYEPGRYVTLLAQEAGAGPDHMNYYFRHDDTPHVGKWTTDYAELYEILFNQYNTGEPEVITGPHHYTYDRGDDRYPFGLFDTRSARFVEVYSSHGTSEYLGNPRPCSGARDTRKFMQAGLGKGLRFGVIGSSDNHDSHPGRTIWGHYPGGLVAFRAKELTRKAIWDALWNYRTYATSFDRIYLDFTINGQPMGSDVTADAPCRIKYDVIGQTDDLEVFLIRNNEEHRIDRATDGVVEIAFEETPPQGETFYYLRVVQDNGERAWSTPIWITRPRR